MSHQRTVSTKREPLNLLYLKKDSEYFLGTLLRLSTSTTSCLCKKNTVEGFVMLSAARGNLIMTQCDSVFLKVQNLLFESFVETCRFYSVG